MVWLLLGIFCLLPAQDISILVVDIGLVGDVIAHTPNPPGKLNLGIEAIAQAPYKLSFEDEVISAGILHKGLNIIVFDTQHMFLKSDNYQYELSLMSGGKEFKQPFTLTVELDAEMEESEAEVEPQVELLERELALSLYINDQLFAARSKKQVEPLSMEFKLPPMPQNYDPFNPNPQDDPMMNSVSILNAVGLAYYLARQVIFKEGESRPPANPLRIRKQITSIFLRRNPLGIEQEVKAILTLTSGKEVEN